MVEDVLKKIGECLPHKDLAESIRVLAEKIEKNIEGPVGASVLRVLAEAVEENETSILAMSRHRLRDFVVESEYSQEHYYNTFLEEFDPSEFLSMYGLDTCFIGDSMGPIEGRCSECGFEHTTHQELSNKYAEMITHAEQLSIRLDRALEERDTLAVQNRILRRGGKCP